jgi:hypothetical protein
LTDILSIIDHLYHRISTKIAMPATAELHSHFLLQFEKRFGTDITF